MKKVGYYYNNTVSAILLGMLNIYKIEKLDNKNVGG